MALLEQANTRNRLLSRLVPEDFDALAPYLQPVDLPRGFVLTYAGVPIEHAYFLETGLGSVVAETQDKKGEIAVVGRDGMIDIAIVLGAAHSPFQAFMQIGGNGWSIPASVLSALIADRPTLRAPMLRHVQASYVQTAFTALANATHTVEERLARWLLMSQDRGDDAQVPLTHEFLSLMLAVRRPSVTVALHVLEGERWIRARRGLITILDRPGLEDFAGTVYSKAANEIERLLAA